MIFTVLPGMSQWNAYLEVVAPCRLPKALLLAPVVLSEGVASRDPAC
jgi:hypothetical protein